MLRKHFNKEKRLYQLIHYAKRRDVTSPLFLTKFTETVSMHQVHKTSIPFTYNYLIRNVWYLFILEKNKHFTYATVNVIAYLVKHRVSNR